MKFDLLILWRNGNETSIYGVTEYGYDLDTSLFYFVKNGRRSFVAKDAVSFFGSKFDFDN